MLHQKEILDTIVRGVKDGIWVAQLMRPDQTTKTFWRTEIDEQALRDPALEVFLPEAATLSDIAPALLSQGTLPGLWNYDAVTVEAVMAYFAGGHSVTVPREGYEDTVFIPKCDSGVVERAISEAVEQGIVWMVNGPASILGEPIPAGVLSPSATLDAPPTPISGQELTEESIPDAWTGGRTNALAIMTALSNRRGGNLPWSTIQSGLQTGIRSRWIELSPESGPWPCGFAGAQFVLIQAPSQRLSDNRGTYGGQKRLGTFTAEASLEAGGIQDLAEQIPALSLAAVGTSLTFNIRIELGGDTPPNPEAIEAINALLTQVSEELKLS